MAGGVPSSLTRVSSTWEPAITAPLLAAVGLTVGKWKVDDGQGEFSGVHDIRDVLGTYAQASANAGAVKSGEAQVLTKGDVSLALAGSGRGVNLGVDIGGFTIEAAK